MKLFLFCLSFLLMSAAPSNLRVLFNSLDPDSIPEHLAFYELYPETTEGKQALSYAWKLISKDNEPCMAQVPNLTPAFVQGVISLISKGSQEKITLLKSEELNFISQAAANLPNRKLAGHKAKSEEEVKALSPEEIDLARGLMLAQRGDNESISWEEILSYEAMIDLMAMQILTRISLTDPPEVKIRHMNQFIFEEMGFRFPPHSLYAKDIDIYTFLPSVLDSRKGVCLGVSVLYICLAQRLGLPLEMVTPPGHIYVRYHSDDSIINIETTARGIHIDCEEYLGIDTPYLKMRNVKDVIGLTYFNEASVHLQKQNYAKALTRYRKAAEYIPEDALLKELTAYTLLFLGKEDEGKALLAESSLMPESKLFGFEGLARDYLQGNVNIEGIQTVFLPVDENRESIIKKKEQIEKILVNFPSFASGYFNLAVAWLQLHRQGEALAALEQYHRLVQDDSKAEYYLTILNALRLNYPQSKKHLQCLENSLQKIGRIPKAFKDLKRELALRSP